MSVLESAKELLDILDNVNFKSLLNLWVFKLLIFLLWLSTSIVFFPRQIQQKMHIYEFIDKYDIVLSPIFWFGLIFFVIYFVIITAKEINKTRSVLMTISYAEMEYLREFHLQDTPTILIKKRIKPVIELQQKGIIQEVPSYSPLISKGYGEFRIDPNLTKYIKPSFFRLPNDLTEMSEEQWLHLLKNCPIGVFRRDMGIFKQTQKRLNENSRDENKKER